MVVVVSVVVCSVVGRFSSARQKHTLYEGAGPH